MFRAAFCATLLAFSVSLFAGISQSDMPELGLQIVKEKNEKGGSNDLTLSFVVNSEKGSLLFVYLTYADSQGRVLKVPVFMHEKFSRERFDYKISVDEKMLDMLRLELFYSSSGKEGDSYLVLSGFQDLNNIKVKDLGL